VTGRIVSTDLYYAPAPETDALAVDLTTGAILAVAARDGAAAAAVLAVSDRIPSGDRLDPEAVERAEVELGRVGAAAFSA
jgi:purine-nucleoside phosphorylase